MKRSQLVAHRTNARPVAATAAGPFGDPLRRHGFDLRAGDGAGALRRPEPRRSQQMFRDRPERRLRESAPRAVLEIAPPGPCQRSGKVLADNGFPLEELIEHSWISFQKRKRSNHHPQPGSSHFQPRILHGVRLQPRCASSKSVFHSKEHWRDWLPRRLLISGLENTSWSAETTWRWPSWCSEIVASRGGGTCSRAR